MPAWQTLLYGVLHTDESWTGASRECPVRDTLSGHSGRILDTPGTHEAASKSRLATLPVEILINGCELWTLWTGA